MLVEQVREAIPPLLRGLLHKEYIDRKFGITYGVSHSQEKQITDNYCIIDSVKLVQGDTDISDVDVLSAMLSKELKKYFKKHNTYPKHILIHNIGSYKVEETFTLNMDLYNEVRGSIIFIAGAAQGIGAELAKLLLERDAIVFIADINYELAKSYAKSLCQAFGKNRAHAIKIDVCSESSVAKAVRKVIDLRGGIDVLISNVGIVKPGAVESYALNDFTRLMTVNYVGYFLLVKHFVPSLRLQNSVHGKYFTDIIQINSKSGIEGSAKNSAYAGSKFGGIGLTRSFAHELVPDNIKVNAICPGNYYDGNLWSDPEKGLFMQFLKTGRVPNAKTPADVRKFYEEKTPMKRGVQVGDILRAVIYVIEQAYETGQAIPVTGGQIMLH